MLPPLNCSSVLQCQALALNIHQLLPLYIVISGISLFGMICNLLSFLALIKCTCEFNQFLTVFTFNSFILNTHYFLSHLLRATSATDSFGFWFFSLTIYFPLAPICFTLGGLLDILIMFERLQLFIKCLQLFSKLSAKRWSLACLVLCLAITVPVVLSQQPATHRAFIGNSTQPIEFYSVEKSEHFEHTLFTVVFYLCVGLRDFVPLVLEVTLNIVLFMKLRAYLKKKRILLAENKNHNKAIIKNFKKCDENNTLLAVIMCLLSAATHLLSLIRFFNPFSGSYLVVLFSENIFNLVVTLKHAINMFIFYRFNKIFKVFFRKTILRINEPMTEIDKLF